MQPLVVAPVAVADDTAPAVEIRTEQVARASASTALTMRRRPGLKVQDLQPDHVVDFGGQIIRRTSAVSLSYDREHIRAGQRSYFLNLLPRLCHSAIDGHDLVSFANALAIFLRTRLDVTDNRRVHRHW